MPVEPWFRINNLSNFISIIALTLLRVLLLEIHSVYIALIKIQQKFTTLFHKESDTWQLFWKPKFIDPWMT